MFYCTNVIMLENFKLCIQCITYNQSVYISDAMSGFAMQQTNFPFVSVIIDDASIDGEQEVIKSYIEEHFDHSQKIGYREWETEDACWIYGRHKENENCHFVAVFLKRNLFKEPDKKGEVVKDWTKAKYIALCEGDDYWIDPLKLQKQVDFMESHPDFSMCFHGADVKNESHREVWTKCETIETREYFSKDVFPDWIVPTASILYRREMVEKYPFKHDDWVTAGDIVLILKGMHTGRVWGMADHMSVYRMNNGSLMAKPMTLKLLAKMCKHYEALMLNFPCVDKEYCKNFIASFHYTRFRKEPLFKTKVKHLFQALKFSPIFVLKKVLRIH